MNRRILLIGGAAGSAMVAPGAEAAAAGSLSGPYVDLSTGQGNMLVRARMEGDLDESHEKYGAGTGTVAAVRPGEAIRDLFGFEIFSAARLRRQPDGSFRLLHREVVYYTDLATGDILTRWTNPWTGETVKVVDVANDPWNELIEEYAPRPPSYGGLIADTAPRKPFVRKWSLLASGVAATNEHINLYYPASLKPDKWPRESAGTMNQVSESFTYFVPANDLQDRRKTSLEYHGTWVRVTPWLPWMLMGQAPGHILYEGVIEGFGDVRRAKPKVIEHTAAVHPQMLHAPTEWSNKSLSSLEDYARTQAPAPPLK